MRGWELDLLGRLRGRPACVIARPVSVAVAGVPRATPRASLERDRRSGRMEATAASGLEEEVEPGVRIPVGKGFAGRIAAQGRPVILDEVDHTKVSNPILVDKGIRSLMGAP